MKLKELLISIMHLKTLGDFIMAALVAIIGGIFGYFKVIYFDNVEMFEAIAWVVVIDFLAGVSVAFKSDKFQTKKALKLVYYLATYWTLLAMVLQVEKGFPSAFWLSEAIIMPILVFQVISVLKNLNLLGIIQNPLLTEILTKIDKHKEPQR
jgi:phage-related holin